MPRSESPRNPFTGATDLFSELTRMRELGTHGREHAREDKNARTPARGSPRPTSWPRARIW